MEGHIWGLNELRGCREEYTPAHEKILAVPKSFIKQTDMVSAGDMVSWHGLWHRVCRVDYDEAHEELVMTLAH
jgi:hypothetical protein